MKIIEKLDLIDKISVELQARYTFTDIDALFDTLKLEIPPNIPTNSKRVYAKTVLAKSDEITILQLADELEIPGHTIALATGLPEIWPDETKFRLFISHISKDAKIALRLKKTLEPYKISAFVAHEDIVPTREWQDEVERALNHMDALVAVHTEGFSNSHWAQQEIGFALGAGKKVISLKMDEDPAGFISKNQAILRKNRKAEAVSEEIYQTLKAAPHTTDRLATVEALSPPPTDDEEVPF